jgi:hypothetical protein
VVMSSVDADRARNIQLLKEGAWFDIPVVYSDGRRTIIALEKGTPGDRALPAPSKPGGIPFQSRVPFVANWTCRRMRRFPPR